MGQSTLTSLFRTIPPERVGLHGEYDHYGLAKRVVVALGQSFEPEEYSHLRVAQRGAVVTLSGAIYSQRSLARLVSVILSVSGAADVEVNGVSMGDRPLPRLAGQISQEAVSKLMQWGNPA